MDLGKIPKELMFYTQISIESSAIFHTYYKVLQHFRPGKLKAGSLPGFGINPNFTAIFCY